MRSLLLTPGPTPVPERLALAMAVPIIHHRTAEFENLMSDIRLGLKKVFGTEQEVLILAASGTGAMEAALVNLFSAGDRVVSINAGKFGSRWSSLGKTYGLDVAEVKAEHGKSISLESVKRALPRSAGLLFQASETSTGLKLDTEALTSEARLHGALSVCDSITGCGIFPLPMDRWGVDVMLSASQKAFMLPPGLAMVALSERAWKAAEKATLPKFYFSLKRQLEAQTKNQTAWTPATSLLLGLRESLKMILEEGLEARYRRHELLARGTREAVQALGLELLSKESPSEALTAFHVPPGFSASKILRALRERFGVVMAGGQDELSGKILRICHFGYVSGLDLIAAFSALEQVLKDEGYNVRLGQSAEVLSRILSCDQRPTR